MKVLFICPNRQRFVHPVPPIGVLYLASILREKGHEVRLVDLMFSRRIEKDVAEAVDTCRPDVVGISLRNVDSLISKTEFSMPLLELCVRTVRQGSRAPIVLGGAGYSLFPKEILSHTGLDLGIVGEGDHAFPMLVERLANAEPYRDVPGLCYRENGHFVSNPPQAVTDLDAIPFQAIDLIDAKKYDRNRGALGIFTRKACPLSCIYCPESFFHGQRVRLRSPQRVVDEIEYIIGRSGVHYFDFADTTFNVPRRHAVAVCEEIIRRGLDFRFEVELSPLEQDEESVKLLKAAGCVGVDLTADSGSDRMLATLKKGFTAEMVLETASLYRRHGLPYTVGFLLGGPGEDVETIEETVALARRLPRPNGVYFTVGIRLFEQTELYELAKRRDPSLDDGTLLEPRFYVSESFDERCAEKLLEACRRHRNFYISDLFYKPSMKWFIKSATLLNVRPAWKFGRLPKLFQRFVEFGSDGLYWDDAKRAFTW